MLVSFVLRLVPDQLAAGLLVGEIEAVVSGEHRAVRGVQEIVDFCVGPALLSSTSSGIDHSSPEGRNP